ncbi:NAD(P)H-binding protein [Actinokineospora soli]|uniref:NAD(P)H-binding protein n=1 Tax=Actinokineospora soli TaxID=1048753 RepID=A0ABW2TXW0_9PSEU
MIVVTGATGNVGKPLVAALVDAGQQVTAVARGDVPEQPGVRAVRADLADAGAMRAALTGADALFLLTSGDFLGRGGDLGPVLDAAKAARVRRVVLLSSQGVGTQRHPAHLEDAVTGSGLEWVVLRPGNFASNTLAWAEHVRAHRRVEAPFGDVALPVIDPVDIAEVAAAALTGDGHAGSTYVLTGPTPISPRGQADTIAEALGEAVGFRELTREEARERMVRFMPPPVVESTLDILGAPKPDEQRVSPDVERVLGKAPRPYADWVKRSLAAFA